jgi:predicted DNA-binding protein
MRSGLLAGLTLAAAALEFIREGDTAKASRKRETLVTAIITTRTV